MDAPVEQVFVSPNPQTPQLAQFALQNQIVEMRHEDIFQIDDRRIRCTYTREAV